MSRKSGQQPDPLGRELECALLPDRYVSYSACYGFVSNLEKIEAQIAKLILSEPDRAVSLYETFHAACCEKANDIDDSSGSFGMFVDGLVCGWIKARQAACADRNETAARLLAWKQNDPFWH